MIRQLPLVALASLCASTGAFAADFSLFKGFDALAARAEARRKIDAFAAETLAPAFANVARSLDVTRFQDGLGLRTTHTSLRLNGIPVFGAGVSHHAGADSMTADLPLVAPSTWTPAIDARAALAIASLRSTNPLASQPELRLLPSADRTRTDLVWWVDFRSTDVGSPGATVVVDAATGRVLAEMSKLETAKHETEVYNAHERGIAIKVKLTPQLEQKLSKKSAARIRPADEDPRVVGCTVYDLDRAAKENIPIKDTAKEIEVPECEAIVEGKDPRGGNACQIVNAIDGSLFSSHPDNCELYSLDGRPVGTRDRSAEAATENARMVFDYYSDRFGRRSFDGQGSTLRSVVKSGLFYSNAAWLSDLNFMVYGMGDGENFGDFTQLVDVAGHEMTHGVVRATANLAMMDEPGALNEATADFFGLQISRYSDWEIGVGLYLKRPNDGLRSLWNPGKYSDEYFDEKLQQKVTKPNPAKYSDRYRTTAECGNENDRCFVHMNSTVMGHAYFRIRTSLGKGKSEDLIFLALTQYYRENTNFAEAARLLRKACSDLTRVTPEQASRQMTEADCDKVDQALKFVEL
jgi:Zn-dependent metalloprotease